MYISCVCVGGCLHVRACSFIYLFHFTLIESSCILFFVCGCMWVCVGGCMCAFVLSFTYFISLYNCIYLKVKFGKWLGLFLCFSLSIIKQNKHYCITMNQRCKYKYFMWMVNVLVIHKVRGVSYSIIFRDCLIRTSLFCFIEFNMHNTSMRI